MVDDRILGATVAEMVANESLDIKVDRVADRAGVNKTTIYRRYPTRDELVLAAIDSLTEARIPIPDTGDLRRDLLELCRLVRGHITSPIGRTLLAASSPSLDTDFRSAFWRGRFDDAATILTRAAERGCCHPPDSPEQLRDLIEIMVAPLHFRANQTGGDLSDRFLEVQVDRLMAAIEAA